MYPISSDSDSINPSLIPSIQSVQSQSSTSKDKKTALTYNNAISILKIELQEKKQLSHNYVWYNFKILALNALIPAIPLSYFVSQFWTHGTPLTSQYHSSYGAFNVTYNNQTLSGCVPGSSWVSTFSQNHGPANIYVCPNGQFSFTAANFFQDAGLILFDIVGSAGGGVLFSWLETLSLNKFLEYYHASKFTTAVSKIQSFVQRLTPFGNSTLNSSVVGEEINHLDLSEKALKSLVQSVNTAQLRQCLKHLGIKKFENLTKNVLSYSQSFILSFFHDLKDMDLPTARIAIIQLKDFINNDPSLWGEIVDAIEELHGDKTKVKNVLLQIGKEIGVLQSTSEIEDLRKSISVTIVTNDYKFINQIEIPIKKLRRYEYFQAKIIEQQKIQEKDLLIKLETNEKSQLKAWCKFLHYIDTDEIELDKDSVLEILPIAIDANAFECTQICFDFLWENQEQYEMFFFFNFMLLHTNPAETKSLYISINQKFQKSLTDKQYNELDEFLMLPKIDSLLMEMKEKIKKSIRTQIKENPESIHALLFCTPLTKLFPIIETVFSTPTHVNHLNFRKLWEFSFPKNSKKIQAACKAFFKQQQGDDLAKIYLLWPPGEFPAELENERRMEND